jgi:hypothetical protein
MLVAMLAMSIAHHTKPGRAEKVVRITQRTLAIMVRAEVKKRKAIEQKAGHA